MLIFDFDAALPRGWSTRLHGADFGWSWQSGATPTKFTGPERDHGDERVMIAQSKAAVGGGSLRDANKRREARRSRREDAERADTAGRPLPRRESEGLIDSQLLGAPLQVQGHKGAVGGHYFYVESSSRKQGEQAWLGGPVPAGSCVSAISFWYHMEGVSMGTLELWVRHRPPRAATASGRALSSGKEHDEFSWGKHHGKANGGGHIGADGPDPTAATDKWFLLKSTGWRRVWTRDGEVKGGWQHSEVALTEPLWAERGGAVRFVGTVGKSYLSDMAIDDVGFVMCPPTPPPFAAAAATTASEGVGAAAATTTASAGAAAATPTASAAVVGAAAVAAVEGNGGGGRGQRWPLL